jgi:mannose-6-phosphate isomerase-like protein (cupin superfamily)
MSVIRSGTLPATRIGREFIGSAHGVAGISFIILEAPPGTGPRLHRHDYDEVIIVLEGTARVWAGDHEVELNDRDVLTIPAGTPHRFTNVGHTTLRQIDIHASSQFQTEWLASESEQDSD